MKITTQEMASRLNRYCALMRINHLNALVLTNPADIFYLTNFKNRIDHDQEAVVVLTIEDSSVRATIVVPKMYQDQLKHIFKSVIPTLVDSRQKLTAKVVELLSGRNVGFDGEQLRYNEFLELSGKAKKMKSLTIGNGRMRKLKSNDELEKLRKAQEITYKALFKAVELIKPGMSEKSLAQMIEIEMEKLGADGVAFDPIVASGEASAIPHYMPEKGVIDAGVLLIDCGAKKDGYCGDLTRTFYLGNDTEIFAERFSLVNQAHQDALAKIKAGNLIAAVDLAVREVFHKAAVVDFFLHSTGHGVGLEIHEYPKLSYRDAGRLETGMVLTVEPGLYFSDWGGIRIEDMIVVTDDGYQLLNKPDRNWQL